MGGAIAVLFFSLRSWCCNKRRLRNDPVDPLGGREGEHAGDTAVSQRYLTEAHRTLPTAATEMSEAASTDHLMGRDRRVSGLSVTTQTRLNSGETSTVLDH